MTLWAESLILPLESPWSVLNKAAWLNTTTVHRFLESRYAGEHLSAAAGRDSKGRLRLPTRWVDHWAHRAGDAELQLGGQPLAKALFDRWTGRPGHIEQDAALRTCPECLAVGYHSIVHQMAGFEVCVFHGSPLRSGCPSCGNATAMNDVADPGSLPFGCARCRWTPPESWMPIASKRAEGVLRRNAVLFEDWLSRAEHVFVPSARVAHRCADGFSYADLSRARAHACVFAEAYPENLFRPANPLESISFDIVPGGLRYLTNAWRVAPLHQTRETEVTMQELLDGVESGILRLFDGRHLCAFTRTDVRRAQMGGAVWEVGGLACPLGVALAVWRTWSREFLEMIHRDGWALEGLDRRWTRTRVASCLFWEWCVLAVQLAEAYESGGRSLRKHRFTAAAWWEQGWWCKRHDAQGLPACSAAAFPTADYTLWARMFSCPFGGRDRFGSFR